MGLDIYLHKCPDLALATAAREAAEAETQAAWDALGEYEDLTEAQKVEGRAKAEEIAKKHGLSDTYGRHASDEEVCNDSAIDPEHMFKVGYFRSSYNGSGIERILRNLSLPTLHDIFQPEDRYEFAPDWSAALERVNDLIARYEAHLQSSVGGVRVMELRPMFDRGVSSEAEALEMYRKEAEREHPADCRSFSKANGEFYLDGLNVRAFITKRYQPPAHGDVIGRRINTRAVYVIYDVEREGKEDWHLTALRIVRETIEFVLAQPDKQHFYLVWSG